MNEPNKYDTYHSHFERVRVALAATFAAAWWIWNETETEP